MDEQETRIESVAPAGPGGIAVDIVTPAGFTAQPGQFVKVAATVDGTDHSSIYTISSPDVDGAFETTVVVDPDGGLSPWLAEAESGAPIRITGPFGSAHYEGEERTVVICGGPGVGPAVAIAERTVADGGESAIVYQDDEPLHEDRLAALEEAGVTVFVLGPADPLAPAVTDVVTGREAEQVFVYGFGGFVKAARDALATVAPGREPKIENFG